MIWNCWQTFCYLWSHCFEIVANHRKIEEIKHDKTISCCTAIVFAFMILMMVGDAILISSLAYQDLLLQIGLVLGAVTLSIVSFATMVLGLNLVDERECQIIAEDPDRWK